MFGFRDVVEAKDRPVPRVFHPLTLRNITLANRIGVSPMCTYSSQSGFATDWHLVHYGKFAMYGFGLVMIEATAVLPEGRITPYDMGLWCDDHVAPLARIARFVHTVGGKAGIQIGHAGRKASTLFPHTSPTGQYHTATDDYGGWVPIGPTTVPFDALLHRKPREITDDELEEVKAAFVKAAKRANRAGFDLLEIHAAHGYLISSFMSPLVNKRTDGYGGSFENRVRLLLEIVEAIRATDPRSAASDMDIADDCDCDCWPKGKPLFVRLSGTEWVDDGGWSVEDTKRLAPLLYAAGADLIDVSSGGINPTQQINPFPLYQTPMSAGIKATVPNSVTATVGLITEPRQAEMILQRDCADVVFIGRQALREPEWPLRAARELGAVVEYPTQYSLVSRRR
ncbi:NADH:flavin oxidoreductase/NADH oxidase [Ramicandelaber brevisporus]|nr:NADH:flavin oxidoreductase/NADH oxidase [Ramicandelaber brevisporus]